MAILEFIRHLFDRRIIIHIHGLDNKPPAELLAKWSRLSIREGLARIGRPRRFFKFELVYWANYFYDRPRDPSITDKHDPYYLDDPYVPSTVPLKGLKPSRIKRKVLDFLEKQLDNIFFDEKRGIRAEKISELIIRNLFRDLDVYYHKNCVVPRYAHLKAREALRAELAKSLRRHRRKKIMLIAHSMGTIIAYDVLTRTEPGIFIDTLVTIGSPLGLPLIVKKTLEEQGRQYRKGALPPAPENIGKWLNFSDLGDPVAMNYNLADDFSPNSKGVGPVDFIVKNDYEYDGSGNAHKSYGYLRAPELSQVIDAFLGGK